MTAGVSFKSQLVAIGCSAGGLEALSILLSKLQAPFPAPIVIAQHLDPQKPSHLTELLSRRSALPVRKVEERTKLEPGIVYVVPAGQHVAVNDHELHLQPHDGERPKPSVDLLLQTAADAYGENLIAIILTGSGTDGAAGARHVKECGGIVIVENPETASFRGMPEALAPTTVDITADLERIGPLLQELLTGKLGEPQLDEDRRLQTILDLVRERSGIDFKKYKQATILRRLRRRMAATETPTIEKYTRHLREHPEEYQRLINTFLIKVTEFMRDQELFAYLKDAILPELILQARQENKTLRIWSAGCATGEESYSVAILVAEILGDELEDFNVRIFATDIDSDAVSFARRGCYAPDAVAHLPPDLVERYFVAVEGHYQIKKRIRNLTVFGEHDLGQRSPFPHIDLVMCRNVLIYFTSELQRRTLQLFAFSLRENGYLVLGKAETTSPLGEFFAPHDAHNKVYLRRGERVLIPPTRISQMPLKRAQREKSVVLSPRVPKVTPRTRMPIDALLLNLPFGIVLVDSRYDILEINNTARRLLDVHGPAVGKDFVHLAQGIPHRALIQAIDSAFHGEAPSPIQVAIEYMPSSAPKHITVTCCPQSAETELQRSSCILIMIQDVTAMVHQQRAFEATLAEQNEARVQVAQFANERAQGMAEIERLRRENAELRAEIEQAKKAQNGDKVLMQQLMETNRRLLRDNEELTLTHEQLRAANEELMLSSEEAQAATEEVETLNEELQATNEELETVNEELQSTIEELNTTNADLEARSREIHDLAAPIEAERVRLSVILRSIGDGLLVVDRKGVPVLTNDAYHQIFGTAQVPLTDEKGRLLRFEELPEQRASRGEKFQMEFTLPGLAGSVRHLEAKGHPIEAFAQNSQEGGVIVIRDISERSIRKLQDRFMAMASHELRTPLVPLHGYLDMLVALLPSDGDGDRLRRYAALAQRQAERLEKLVDDLVSATRIQTGRFQVTLAAVELGALVAHAVELAQMEPKHPPVHLEVPAGDAEPMIVKGDAGRLEQVVMNLLNNAFRYASQSPRIDVRLRRAKEEAEIEVQDHGPGIQAVDLPHLFSSFYQAEHAVRSSLGGLGLGLHICKEIVTAHGGQISVQSMEGEGATFLVRLPLMPFHDRHD